MTPPDDQLNQFVGCFEVVLGERFPRPADWPSRLDLKLTAGPGDLHNWFPARSSAPWRRSPNWTLLNETTVLLDWNEPRIGRVQLHLQVGQGDFSLRSTTEPYSIEARSVRKLPCKQTTLWP